MSGTTASEVVKRFYALLGIGDGSAALQLLHPKIEWTEAERTPYYCGTVRGVDAILASVFVPLERDFDNFSCTPHKFVTEGDQVVAFGTYAGLARITGRTMTAPFVHLWIATNGRLQTFSQYTDSAVWSEALAMASFPQ